LEDGDAVMTAQGLRIFIGDRASHHDDKDFAKLSEVTGLSKQEKIQLLAIDANQSERGRQEMPGAGRVELKAGRSAAGDTNVKIIADPKGGTLRYVGP
jgi:hypothetical protein